MQTQQVQVPRPWSACLRSKTIISLLGTNESNQFRAKGSHDDWQIILNFKIRTHASLLNYLFKSFKYRCLDLRYLDLHQIINLKHKKDLLYEI